MSSSKVFELRPSAGGFCTIRDLIASIVGVLFGPQSPSARFERVLVRAFEASGDPESPDSAHLLRPATADELAYCREAWQHAKLEPIEDRRRAESGKYKRALDAYRKLHPKYPTYFAFVLDFKTKAKSLEDEEAFHKHATDIVSGMAAAGAIELRDSAFRPAVSYSGSKLLLRDHARAVCHQFGVSYSFESQVNEAARRARTPTEIHLSGDYSRPYDKDHQLQRERFQACLDAGLRMPANSEQHLPDGISRIGEIVCPSTTRQAFCGGLKKYIDYLIGQEAEAVFRGPQNRPVKVA